MLQRMIQTENIEDAQNIANALGLYFRYLTRNSMDHVTLAEEYEHAKIMHIYRDSVLPDVYGLTLNSSLTALSPSLFRN